MEFNIDVGPGDEMPEVPNIEGMGGCFANMDTTPPGEDFFRGSGYIMGIAIRIGELVGLHEKPGPNGYYPSDDPMTGSENGLNPANAQSKWDKFKHDAWG